MPPEIENQDMRLAPRSEVESIGMARTDAGLLTRPISRNVICLPKL